MSQTAQLPAVDRAQIPWSWTRLAHRDAVQLTDPDGNTYEIDGRDIAESPSLRHLLARMQPT